MLVGKIADIDFTVVPDEISQEIFIRGCPIHCPQCHTPELWDTYTELLKDFHPLSIRNMIKVYDNLSKRVTCINFYGGEWDNEWLIKNLLMAKGYGHKTSLYSGRELSYFINNKDVLNLLDYLKVGPYSEFLGGLTSVNTNQRMYKLKDGNIIKDITDKFWRFNV